MTPVGCETVPGFGRFLPGLLLCGKPALAPTDQAGDAVRGVDIALGSLLEKAAPAFEGGESGLFLGLTLAFLEDPERTRLRLAWLAARC